MKTQFSRIKSSKKILVGLILASSLARAESTTDTISGRSNHNTVCGLTLNFPATSPQKLPEQVTVIAFENGTETFKQSYAFTKNGLPGNLIPMGGSDVKVKEEGKYSASNNGTLTATYKAVPKNILGMILSETKKVQVVSGDSGNLPTYYLFTSSYGKDYTCTLDVE